MERNVFCSLCEKKVSDRFCICTDLPCICSECWEGHEGKKGFHFALPIAAKEHITPANRKKVCHTLMDLADSHEKLKENIPALDKCSRDVEAAYEDFIQKVVTSRNQILSKLQELKAAFAASVEEAIKDTSLNAYRIEDYEPNSHLGRMIRTHCLAGSPDALQAFRFEVQVTDEPNKSPLQLTIRIDLPGLSSECVDVRVEKSLSHGESLEETSVKSQAEKEEYAPQLVALTEELAAVQARKQLVEAEVQRLVHELDAANQLQKEAISEGVKERDELKAQCQHLIAEVERLQSREETKRQAPTDPWLLVHVSETDHYRVSPGN